MDDNGYMYNRNNMHGTKIQGIAESLEWSGVICCHRYDETVGHEDIGSRTEVKNKLECDGIHRKGECL